MGKELFIEKYLYDILESIHAIRTFSQGISDSNDLRKKHLERSAIERKIEIIGEALKNAESIQGNISIRNLKKIKDTRNIIAHDYDGINYKIIWSIIQNNLDELEEDVNILLSGV